MRRTACLLGVCGVLSAIPPFPSEPKALPRTVPFEAMERFLKASVRPGFLTLTEEGRSHQGRPIYSVRLARGPRPTFRVLFYAQQHGDELAGKDAQLYLIQRFLDHPERLPEDVELTLIPTLNPDGGVAGTRVNGAGADLNRDHLCLSQPETRTFYRVVRRVRPHLAVDSHEFGRDPASWTSQGWVRWPLITLDGMSHPLLPEAARTLALRRMAEAQPLMAAAGIPFARYAVGGPPPDEEMRPSTPEVDDGRNGVGSHGAVSFIIESGIRHHAPDPQGDLGLRVDAYLRLYDHLLGEAPWREEVRQAAEAMRRQPLPAFLPVNTFWATTPGSVAEVQVLSLASGQAVSIPSANVMSTLVVKAHVPTPRAYAIAPEAAARFRPVLEGHGLTFTTLTSPQTLPAETCRLLRYEAPEDPDYRRHADRTWVQRGPRQTQPLPVGTLVVPLDQPLALRAVQVLEPCLLYGLYSYADFRALAAPDGTLPVRRLF